MLHSRRLATNIVVGYAIIMSIGTLFTDYIRTVTFVGYKTIPYDNVLKRPAYDFYELTAGLDQTMIFINSNHSITFDEIGQLRITQERLLGGVLILAFLFNSTEIIYFIFRGIILPLRINSVLIKKYGHRSDLNNEELIKRYASSKKLS